MLVSSVIEIVTKTSGDESETFKVGPNGGACHTTINNDNTFGKN